MIEKIQFFIDKIAAKKDKSDSYLNSLKIDQAITIFESFQKLCWIIPSVLWGIHFILFAIPIIKTLNFQFLVLLFFLIAVLNLVASFTINRYLFYFTSDRTDLDPKERITRLWEIQRTSDLQVALTEGAILELPITFTVMPYFEFLRLHPTVAGVTTAMVDEMSGNPYILRVLLFSVGVIGGIYLFRRLRSAEELKQNDIDEWMVHFHYQNKDLHSVLTGDKRERNLSPSTPQYVSPEPYMILGTSINSGEIIELPPVNRRQNAVYFGPVGAGKTSTIFKPQIKQDIDYYLRFIRDFPKISKDPNFLKTKGNIATHYLNGLAVIETSNDLCTDVYNLAVKLGVPKEKITWLDPTNPKSPALNLLRGPVDTVVETVTNIIAEVKADNNDFFKQSERSHLKNFIFLLKLSCVVENRIATFPDLMALYNDIYAVVDRMKVLDKYVESLNTKLDEAKKKWESNPDDHDLKTRYDELFDKYEVAHGTSQWFHNNIRPKMFGQGVIKQKTGPHEGEFVYEDLQAENVQGLKNSLDDLSKNRYLRRVLFRDTGGFNLDDLLLNGGILLCNTAKAELQDQLAGRLGQIYLMSLQAATFRRKNDCVPMFALYCDEFPDFISEAFKSYIAQARKYNLGITVCAQSPSQLSYSFGQDFFNTLMTNMLTRGTFGDLAAPDAKILEPFFGEHSEVIESINEQNIDLTADQDSNRSMISARREKVPNISASEIMQLPKFTLAVRHPGPHGSEMFDMMKTHYLTDADIESDPNVFDMNNSKDASAFKYMQENARHSNADFDAVDLEIIADIESGKIHYTVTSSSGKKPHNKTPGGDADDDIKDKNKSNKDRKPNIIDDSDKADPNNYSNFLNETSDSDSPRQEAEEQKDNSEESIASYLDGFSPDKEDDANQNSANEDTNNVEIFSSGDDENDNGPDASLVNAPTIDKAKFAKERQHASQIVKQAISDGHANGGNSGNNRLDNDLGFDDQQEKVNKNSTNNLNSENDDSMLEASKKATINQTKKNTEENKVLVKDIKNGKLLETRKNREEMRKQHKKQKAATVPSLQKQSFNELRQKMVKITESDLTNQEKLDQLIELKDSKKEELRVIWGDKYSDILRKIDTVIQRQKKKLDEEPQLITKNDNLKDIIKKTKNSKPNTSEIADELAEMLNQFDDRKIDIDPKLSQNLDKYGSFDSSDNDPFWNQNGMSDN